MLQCLLLGDPLINWNYLLEGRPHIIQASPSQVSVLETHLYECTSWCCCERLRSTSVIFFFWRLFQHVCPFHHGWFASAPAHTTLSVLKFLTKNSMASIPHPPSSPRVTSVYSPSTTPRHEKVLKWKHFAHVEEVKQKNGKNTKRHQNQWVQKQFWAMEKISQ